MNIIFTICSNNYLAQAKALADTVFEHDPDSLVEICLVDEFNEAVDYSVFESINFTTVKQLLGGSLEELWKKYSIIELNTSVKATMFKYLFAKYPDTANILYFDPDICLYHPLDEIRDEFTNSDILLTPHILTPLPVDTLDPSENSFLNFGLYNLGFIGLARSENVLRFLDWWEERLFKKGRIRVQSGEFVDQLWVNLVPIFFDRVKILHHFGCNAAPWNLHERTISQTSGSSFTVNGDTNLLFYHFSSYKYFAPDEIAEKFDRFVFDDCTGVKELYKDYHKRMIENGIERLSSVPCRYVVLRKSHLRKQKLSVRNIVKQFLPPVLTRTYRRIAKNRIK